jgi:hypothetical protein
MVLKWTCILIIIYTVCTCDTLVPTRILYSEMRWGEHMYHSGFERS